MGEHEIRLSLAGHETTVVEVDFDEAGALEEISETLDAVVTTGSVAVSSDPPGARITLDGVDIGEETPATLSDIDAGKHVLLLSLDGHDDVSRLVNVKAGEEAELAVTLPEAVATTAAPATSAPTGEARRRWGGTGCRTRQARSQGHRQSQSGHGTVHHGLSRQEESGDDAASRGDGTRRPPDPASGERGRRDRREVLRQRAKGRRGREALEALRGRHHGSQ